MEEISRALARNLYPPVTGTDPSVIIGLTARPSWRASVIKMKISGASGSPCLILFSMLKYSVKPKKVLKVALIFECMLST
jgi:hypothetical protein